MVIRAVSRSGSRSDSIRPPTPGIGCHAALRSLVAVNARDPPFCSVARLSKDSRGIGQMEHSVRLAPAGASGGQRSGRLRALPPPALGGRPGVLLAGRPSAGQRAGARSVAGSDTSASCSSPDPARPRGRRARCDSARPHRAADQLPGRLAGLGTAGGAVYDTLAAAAAAGHGLPLATRDRRAAQRYRALDADLAILPHRQDQDSQPGRVSPRRCYPAGGGGWPAGRSLPGSRSATNTFCSMCQSSGCLPIPSWNTLASCWVMAAIFSCPVPVAGTGISG